MPSGGKADMPALIVNTPDPMVKVRVMTPKDYSTETLKTLHRAGVLHAEESEELRPVDKEAIEGERRQVGELLTSINDVLDYVPKGERVSLGEDVEVIYNRPLSEIDSEVRTLCTKLGNMHQRATKLDERIKELTELGKYLSSLRQQADITLKDLDFSGSYLFSRVFVFPSELFETLYPKFKDYLLENIVTAVENETVLYGIAKAEDQETIESMVKDGGGKVLLIPQKDLTPGEFLEAIEDDTHNLEQELTKLRSEIENRTRENLKTLILFREALSAETERLAVLAKAGEAKYVRLIEGWVPENNVEAAISDLRENIGYVFIDTRKPGQAEEPPTRMRNATAIKPFEVIVNLFGTPNYREWDPTPVIAYSFAFFFGIMLGDVVYSALLILFARFGLRILTDDPQSEGFKLFQRIIYIGGGVGLVIGLLTGSYLGNFYTFFGIESLTLSAIIQHWLSSPVYFIGLSLIIGLVHVNTAHVLALIKGRKEGQKAIVPNKAGLFLLEIGAIPNIMHRILGMNLPLLTEPIYTYLLFVAGLGLVFIVASTIIERGLFLGSIFWLFDVTGILGDVMSYARLAGVGLATFYLAYAFNLMADLLRGMVPAGILRLVVGSLIFLLVLLFGHLLNLVLSGITCFVHSLRLCFVEFLFKFFDGGGRAYSPFRLKARPVSVKV
jgi:V/A-type H+-transporting ATPase subunit I